MPVRHGPAHLPLIRPPNCTLSTHTARYMFLRAPQQVTVTDNDPVRGRTTHDSIDQPAEQHAAQASTDSAYDMASKGGSGVRGKTPAPVVRAALPSPPQETVQELHVDPVKAGGAPVTVAVMVRCLATSSYITAS